MEKLVISSANMRHFEKIMPGVGFEEDGPEDAFVGGVPDDDVEEEENADGAGGAAAE